MKKILVAFGFALVLAPALASAQLSSGPWGPGALAAPENLQYACTPTGATLSWSPAANAMSYSIRVNIPGHADFVYTGSLFDTNITLRLPMNQEYAWWVHANNAANPLGPYTIGPRFTCGGQSAPAPTLSFTANPPVIQGGQSSVLSWSTTNAISCASIGSAIPGTIGTNGSATVSPNISSVYTISCTGPGGTVTKNVTVIVQELGGTQSCILDGVSVPHGQIRKFYLNRQEASASMCQTNSIDRTCNNGVLSGASSYQYAACTWPGTTGSPSITITAPQNGASVTQGNTFPVSFSITNPQLSGALLKAFVDGVEMPNGLNNPGSTGTIDLRTSTLSLGSHALKLGYNTCAVCGFLYSQTITFTVTAPGTQTFAIGDRVRATSNLHVRTAPSTAAQSLGVQPAGKEGAIIDGPQSGNGYTWWKINWDTNPDGWSVENFIQKVPLYNPNTAAFFQGEHVQAASRLKVRSTPSALLGTVVGEQEKDARGVIIGGPHSAGGFVWWKVDWEIAPDGWTIRNNLLTPLQAAARAREKANSALLRANDSLIKANSLKILPGTIPAAVPHLNAAIDTAKQAAISAVTYAEKAVTLAQQAHDTALAATQLAHQGQTNAGGAATRRSLDQSGHSIRYSKVSGLFADVVERVKTLLAGFAT